MPFEKADPPSVSPFFIVVGRRLIHRYGHTQSKTSKTSNMRSNYSKITAYRKEDRIIVTTKLRGRARREGKPRRGARFIRSIQDWFAMCWGRKDDDDEIDERERLLGEDDDETDEEDGTDECEYEDEDEEEDEDDSDDKRLIGPGAKQQMFVPRHAALSFLRVAAGKRKGCRGWRH